MQRAIDESARDDNIGDTAQAHIQAARPKIESDDRGIRI